MTVYKHMGHSHPLEWASTFLGFMSIVFIIPIIGYIYSPFEEIPNYAPAVRFVFLPVMLLTGLWMWKGHLLRRLVSKRSAPVIEAEQNRVA